MRTNNVFFYCFNESIQSKLSGYIIMMFLIFVYPWQGVAGEREKQPIVLKSMIEIDLGNTIGQLRAVPVTIGSTKAVCAMYSEDTEIDPNIGLIFFRNIL